MVRIPSGWSRNADWLRGRHGMRAEFECVREVGAVVGGGARRGPALLGAARLSCQKGGTPRTAIDCLGCSRFVNYVPRPEERRVVIRCLWSTADVVNEVMTVAGFLHAVTSMTKVRQAEALARHAGVRHLIVVDDGALAGVICRCDLMPDALPGEVVADHMSYPVWVVSPATTLLDAALIMRELQVGSLLVADGDELRGVVTRGDLRRIGLPEPLLGAHFCALCGSSHGVRAYPTGGPDLCLECIEVAARSEGRELSVD